ncbi:MAG: GyrI-like domain-containing protein [Candidatus Pristimantibacillus lignocellulolyticus]|uniref:GyrI-like domain-containing protein n=1 Tax=Candidatus Pristimantibacillus lignocellulolyticus TaxID=2994561 RepID=A0A9J6ZA42_9BACL|nr:MAG: GyrI-like domain-containing protein [Candidatus Pristimantibacillus lignocellulolyticus]
METCSIVNKSTLHLVGVPYCGPYSSFPDEAIRLQTDFLARKHELNHVIQSNVMYCPYFGNETFATYWACFESQYSEDPLPPGMVAITIPMHRYALVSCSSQRIGEGYEMVKAWIQEHGYKRLDQAVSLEIFYLEGQHLEEEIVDILIPIEDEAE